jgi:hypothetical protein
VNTMPSRAPKYAGTLIVLPVVPFDSGDSPANQRANVGSSIMSIQNCKGNVVLPMLRAAVLFVPFASSRTNGLSAEFGSSTESRSTLSWRTQRRHSSPARCKLDFQELTQDRLRLECGRLENVRIVTCRSRGSNPSPATTF